MINKVIGNLHNFDWSNETEVAMMIIKKQNESFIWSIKVYQLNIARTYDLFNEWIWIGK